jgi:hypothetical protein
MFTKQWKFVGDYSPRLNAFVSRTRRTAIRFVVLFIVTAIAGAAQASIIATPSEVTGSATGFTTSTNLITSGQATLAELSASGFVAWNGSSISHLNDNTLGTYYPNGEGNNGVGVALDTGTPWTLTVSLNTMDNAQGYNITNIKTISGFSADWVNQHYTVSYSTVASPNDFISLGTYSVNTSQTVAATPTSLQMSLTDSSGVIASNVACLKFDFLLAPWDAAQKGTAYREVEVYGAAVPEPGTLALLAGGLIGLIAYAWRKRK